MLPVLIFANSSETSDYSGNKLTVKSKFYSEILIIINFKQTVRLEPENEQ